MREEAAAGGLPAGEARREDCGWLLEGLNGEQRRVVCHGPGPLLVVAGPGSGKTRVLIQRIAWLLERGVAQPWEILAVTFSVRAADELQRRLRDMLGVERASGVRAATFHSVCARLLRSNAPQLGRSERFTIYDQIEVRKTIDWLISEKQRGEVAEGLSRHGIAAREIQREISRAKNRLVNAEAYELAAAHETAGLIAGVWRELEVEMRKRDAVDFDDLLVHAVTLLGGRPHVLAQLRSRWRWVLVDEVQDTNPAQLELAALLAAPGGNLTAAGDPDQVVFGFRCADPAGMRRLAERFPAHAKTALGLNYRSRAEILEPAWRCVGCNTGRDPRALIADRGPGGWARAHGFHYDGDEAAWVARQTRRALDADWPPQEILILGRTSSATRPVQEALRHAGIAHRLIGALGLYERAEVKDALAYLVLLANPRDVAAFARAVQSPRRGVGERTVSRFVGLARDRHQGDLLAACADPLARALLANDRARENLRSFGDGLLAVRRELSEDERSLGHVAASALKMRGGIVPHFQWARDHSERSDKRHDAEKVLEDIEALIRHVQVYEQQDPSPTLIGFLEHAAGLGSQEIEAGEEDHRVTVSTVHGSKGGEARLVILIGCEERLLPSWQAVESGATSAIEEERRVFYVACTRAKDALAVTYCAQRNGRPTGGPSRFLAEAGLIKEPSTMSASHEREEDAGMGGTVTSVATTTAKTVGTIAIADQLRHLHERVPLSERDIARATGADEDTVGAWLARKAVPTGIQANRLMETIAVVEEMALNVRPEGLREWLSSKMPALDAKTPADVIAAGGYEQVMDIALGLTYGAFT